MKLHKVWAAAVSLVVLAGGAGLSSPALADSGRPLAAPAAVAAQENATITITGPESANPGDIIDLTVQLPGDTMAFEAMADFDDELLEFGGLYHDDEKVELLSNANRVDHLAIAAHRCGTGSCTADGSDRISSVTVRLRVAEAGQHRFRLSRIVVVAGNGAATDITGTTEFVVNASDGADGEPSGGQAAGTLSTDRSPVAAADADLTGDDKVNQLDLTEVAIGWTEVRRRGDACNLDSGRLTALDLDGSGCLDIADLTAVGAHIDLIGAATRQQLPKLDAIPEGDFGIAEAERAAQAATPMVVNSTSDEWDANLNNGVCNTPSGGCSLRAAILQANANPGPDVIHFNIPGNGPHRINIGGQLPTISDTSGPLLIDGYTQPGARPNQSQRAFDGAIRIEIVAPGYGDGGSAIVISSGGNTIRGLSVYLGFSNIRLTGTNATGNRLVGNFIGTNSSGTYQESSSRYRDQAGVEIGDGASQNVIGSPALADRNVISGNPYSGVRINHAGTRGNIVQNNLVGLTPNGNGSLFTYVAGIDVQWGASDTWVGGYQEHAGNVVVAVTNYGIDLSHSSKNNRVVGNYLGTDVTGTRVLSHTPNLIGLAIKDNTVGNLIEQNVIGGNTRNGVWHRHNFTGANTFRANWIGVGVNGASLGNAEGITISGHDDTYTGNVIANNTRYGISISNFNGGNGFSPPQYTERNLISQNSIYGNGSGAIDIVSSQNNIQAPSITSVSGNTVAGRACGSCRVEVYTQGGRQYIGTATASSGGNWSLSNGAIRNTRITALAIASNDDTSEFGNQVTVGSDQSNSAPSLTSISDRSGVQYRLVTFRATANDSNGDYLTFSAMGLPAGVSIDQRTGVIEGRPGSIGQHVVVVRVDDGLATRTTSFRWTVTGPNANPVIGTLSAQSGTVGQAVSLQLTGSDPDGDSLSFSATGLPNGLSIASNGRITGTPSQAGNFTVRVTLTDSRGASTNGTFSWSISGGATPFTCSVSGSTLSWTNDGASRYYIRQLLNGIDRYLGSSAGLSFGLSSPAGQYTVRHWENGRAVDAVCDAPGGGGGFSCSVSGSTLSWTNDGASRYYIRQLLNGTDRYVGSATGLSFNLTNPAGQYIVRHWVGGVSVDARCSA